MTAPPTRSVTCPDCGAEHTLQPDTSRLQCPCGAALNVAPLLGQLPEQERFAQLVEALSAYESFHKDRVGGSPRYRLRSDEDGYSAELWELSPLQHVITEGDRDRVGLPDRVLLPTQRIPMPSGRVAVHYPTPRLPLRPWGLDTTVSPARSLLELLAAIHERELVAPGLLAEHLAADLRGETVLRAGHLLVDAGVGPEVARRQRVDLRNVGELLYRLLCPDLWPPGGDPVLHPRFRDPDLPPRLWAALHAALHEDEPCSAAQLAALLRPATPRPQLRVELGLASAVGHKPDGRQEDRAGVSPADARGGRVVVVADGVSQGGQGDRAAQIVVDELCGEAPDGWTVETAAMHLCARLERANVVIGDHIRLDLEAAASELLDEDHMSSTAVAAWYLGDEVVIVSVGDSPALLRTPCGHTESLLLPHNEAAEVLRAGGDLLDLEAVEDPGILTGWVGSFEPLDGGEGLDATRPLPVTTDADVRALRLLPGERLLLCSDGVSSCLPAAHLSAALGRPGGAAEIAEELVSLAVAHQHPQRGDNATALVLVAVAAPPPQQDSPWTP